MGDIGPFLPSPMPFPRLKALLITCLLLGGGLWLSAYAWMEVRISRRLDERGVAVEGRVVSQRTQTLSKGGQAFYVTVEYAPGVPAITAEFPVDGSDYKTAATTGKAKVTCLPEEPRTARVTHFAILPFQLLLGLGALITLAGLVCAVMMLKSGPK